MGSRRVGRGAVAARVQHNLRGLRTARRLTQADLSQRLRELGQPILPTGIAKIEDGTRRVDADDLVALAVALGVTPNRLLLPAGTDDEQVPLTPTRTVTAQEAWRWACGDAPLPGGGSPFDLGEAIEFLRTNQPHADLDLDEVEARVPREIFRQIYDLARAVVTVQLRRPGPAQDTKITRQ